MSIRVLFACADPQTLELQQSVLASSLNLVCFAVTFASVTTVDDLWRRVDAGEDDVILLDWHLTDAETPQLVRSLLAHSPRLRIVALLPQGYRQYRHSVWEAGACSSIPTENMDQEWLSSILCVMQRSMQREASLLQSTAN